MPQGYFLIQHVGDGSECDPFRADYLCDNFTGSRHVKQSTHPTHRLLFATSRDQNEIDDLRRKPGVKWLGATLADARAWIETNPDRLSSQILAEYDTKRTNVLTRGDDWIENLYPNSLNLLKEPGPRPRRGTWTDDDVRTRIAQKPSYWPRRNWRRNTIAWFGMNHDDIVRLFGGQTVVACEPNWGGSTACDWCGAAETWAFFFGDLTHTVVCECCQIGGKAQFNATDTGEVQWVDLCPNIGDVCLSVHYTSTIVENHVGLTFHIRNPGGCGDLVMGRKKCTPSGSSVPVQLFDITDAGFCLFACTNQTLNTAAGGRQRFKIVDNGDCTNATVCFTNWLEACCEPCPQINCACYSGSEALTTGDVGMYLQVKSLCTRFTTWHGYIADDLACVGCGIPILHRRRFDT